VAAGGAAEEVARSESLLKTAALFFDLAAPVEFQAESVVLCVSAARGAVARVIPSPVAEMAASAFTIITLFQKTHVSRCVAVCMFTHICMYLAHGALSLTSYNS
jgi:hypothetical protein